jgi:arylsulfatase A-like enzyme
MTLPASLFLRCVAAIAWLASLGASIAADKPHIVFVLADDMGAGDIGCYGGTVAPTPQIDRLAREGTRFTRYYSASPICSPSRCGLITGHYPARWKITSYLQTRAGNRECEQADFLDPRAPSLPRVLQAAGYATAHIGKWHLGGGRDVVDPPKFAAYGYDIGLGTYESPEPAAPLGTMTTPWAKELEPHQVARHDRTRWMVDEALAFLKKNGDRPSFVNLWLDDTHAPWVPAQPAPNDGPKNLAAVIAELDRQIGRLIDGLPANTLLIFATDNGALPTFQGARTAGQRGSKLSLYEGGIRVPFIVRWPGRVAAGKVDETSVIHAIDMMPTLAAIAGAPLPDGYAGDGIDVTAALRGDPVARAKPLFWEYGRNEKSFQYPAAPDRSPNVAMLEGKWKLLINADGAGAELYDIIADPKEAKSVADSNPDVTARMFAAAIEWRRAF